ncbi:MAG: hypothetical protein IMZ60_03180 [Actinobacteria bacterium]|nr:hypothetical protein [Actinomycetota bacterium]
MTDEEIRNRILKVAYEKYKKAESLLRGAFNIYEVSKECGVREEEIERGVEYLVGDGSIKYYTEEGEIHLTHEGVKKCEGYNNLK